MFILRFGCKTLENLITTAFMNNTFNKGLSGLYGNFNDGSSSVARMLPLAFYAHIKEGAEFFSTFTEIGEMSNMTHQNSRIVMIDGIYAMIAANLMDGFSLKESIKNSLEHELSYWGDVEYDKLPRLFKDEFAALPETKIRSTEDIEDTIEAVMWCLLNTTDYKSAVLKAVNLGGDTDNIAAFTGGLAGLAYGEENIPKEWLNVLRKREYLETIAENFSTALRNIVI